jgi:hypothetical protein
MSLLPPEHRLIQLARMDRFLSGPPLHRHFFVPWPNRSKWLPAKLKQTLKAGITYKIDASSASPDVSSVSGSSENAATMGELEVYLCKGYRYGTKDVVALLDAVEPPLQDAQSGSHDGLSFSASHNNDSGYLRTGEGYTRLIFLIEKVPLDATIADKEDEEDGARQARRHNWIHNNRNKYPKPHASYMREITPGFDSSISSSVRLRNSMEMGVENRSRWCLGKG